jgi:hypothetical protein
VTLKRLVRVGWAVLLADVVYWIWEVGHADGDYRTPRWHAIFNTVTFYAGSILFATLLLASYAIWRWNQRGP